MQTIFVSMFQTSHFRTSYNSKKQIKVNIVSVLLQDWRPEAKASKPRFFVIELSLRLKKVLEDPIREILLPLLLLISLTLTSKWINSYFLPCLHGLLHIMTLTTLNADVRKTTNNDNPQQL